MNASKENARKARKLLTDSHTDDSEVHILKKKDYEFVQSLLAAAERKLPTEQAYIDDKKRRAGRANVATKKATTVA